MYPSTVTCLSSMTSKARPVFCRRPVDLVDQHDITEDGSLFEYKTTLPWIKYGGTYHVARHHIQA